MSKVYETMFWRVTGNWEGMGSNQIFSIPIQLDQKFCKTLIQDNLAYWYEWMTNEI